MVAQFFANVFFFLNGAMFNDLIDQGPQLGLYQYSIGSKVEFEMNDGISYHGYKYECSCVQM